MHDVPIVEYDQDVKIAYNKQVTSLGSHLCNHYLSTLPPDQDKNFDEGISSSIRDPLAKQLATYTT